MMKQLRVVALLIIQSALLMASERSPCKQTVATIATEQLLGLAKIYDTEMLRARLIFLCENGADIQIKTGKGMTLVHFAVLSNNLILLEVLLQDRRVNFNVVNNQNFTPLDLACHLQRFELANMLVEHGALHSEFSRQFFIKNGGCVIN